MKIHNKLFSTLLIFSSFLVISFVALMQWSIDRGMVEYVNKREVNALAPLINQLKNNYQQVNGWQELKGHHKKFKKMLENSLAGSEFSLPQGMSDPNRPHNFDGDMRRPPPRRNHEINSPADFGPNEQRPPPQRGPQVSYALLNSAKEYIVGNFPPEREYSYNNIEINEQIIGYLVISKRKRLTAGYELDFIEQQTQYLWLIALGVMLLVILVTLPLARHFLAPIKELAKGMHKLTQGNYNSELIMKRTDEFSELSRDYNELAKTLLENESARKRWLANISHELRTPVAILKGELEAIIDGVRALSLEQIHSANQEVLHLERLIADLQALTSADVGGMNYRKSEIDLTEFLGDEEKKYQSYLSDAGLEFILVCPTDALLIFADETRLCQLLDNLINNCIKYAADGKLVKLTVVKNTLLNNIVITIEDDGLGVEEAHLQHLFEHLYRVDNSRNRKTGGSGLGLSICSHIAEAHQGQISAEKSSMGGLAIIITLPLNTA